MTSMNISLPDNLKSFVDDLIARGGYSTASEYVRELIRDDQKRRAREELEAKLLEGINSGPSVEWTAQDWDDIRRQIRERLEQRKRT